MRTRARLTAGLLAAAMPITLTACSSGSSSTSSGPVTLTYALWDSNQQSAYQACADAFTQANPNIHIKITQAAWGQYWQNLTTQMTAGNAPDVFTDHVAYYPQLVKNNQILDISSRVGRRQDRPQPVPDGPGGPVGQGRQALRPAEGLGHHRAGLQHRHAQERGRRPGDAGGPDLESHRRRQLRAADRQDDRGQEGHNGLDPAFDKNHVKVHGMEIAYDDGSTGQSSWGDLAAENGFTFLDKNPFGTKYHYSDPQLAATVDWFASLAKKGYASAYDKSSTLGPDAVLNAGKSAMTMTGSWNINTYLGSTATQKFAFAPLPTGPQGRRTFINGLSDAIYAGTKHPDQAWQWVKFLGSSSCQDIIASKGVVFPAIKADSQNALATHQSAGQDVKVFVDEATAPGGTFTYPITDHADQITQEVQTDLESVWLGQSSASSALGKAQKAVDGFFAQP